MVLTLKGHVITDSSDLTRADFDDAVGGHERTMEDSCDSEFEHYGCTRLLGHTGPHIAATGPDSVTAIWESEVE